MTDPVHDPGVGAALERLFDDAARPGGARERVRRVRRDVGPVLLASARRAGAAAVLSGRWLTDTVVDLAPRIPIRDRATLLRHHPELLPEEVADRLILSAARATAALGLVAGTLSAAEELMPPTWPAIPFQLGVETLLVVGVEVKLVGELFALHSVALPEGLPERAGVLLRSWASGRADGTAGLAAGDVLGPAARDRVARRLLGRLGRGSTGLLPFAIGGAVSAGLNHRVTRRLGDGLVRDLRRPAR